jgi:hypothetical protein
MVNWCLFASELMDLVEVGGVAGIQHLLHRVQRAAKDSLYRILRYPAPTQQSTESSKGLPLQDTQVSSAYSTE